MVSDVVFKDRRPEAMNVDFYCREDWGIWPSGTIYCEDDEMVWVGTNDGAEYGPYHSYEDAMEVVKMLTDPECQVKGCGNLKLHSETLLCASCTEQAHRVAVVHGGNL